MAKQINPTSYRLGVSQNWWISNIVSQYKEYSYYISQELFIRNIVKKILLTSNVLISEIMIIRTSNHIHLKFYYYNKDKKYNIRYNLYFIKFLLQRILFIPVYFQVTKIPSVIYNANILSQYINNEIKASPKRYKTILKKIIKQYKKWYNY